MGEKILLGHGSGGKLTQQLLKQLILPYFTNPILNRMDDSAVIDLKGRVAFTTDSFVVKPLFFPGSDIGRLAVFGTVNDLAVMGATPLYLTASCIIEEGLDIAVFERIIKSMKTAAIQAGVEIVGGDLKVVGKNACDEIFINTSGLGIVAKGLDISGSNARPGDAVIVSGFIGQHAAAVMAARGDFKLKAAIKSDCAPLSGLVSAALKASRKIRVMRDPTRGGLASTLNEIAAQSSVGIEIYEDNLPVKENVRALCEILGIDPLYMACEGRVVIICGENESGKVLKALRRHPLGKCSRAIGRVVKDHSRLVVLRTAIGSSRILDMPAGEQLPRIC